MRIDVCWKYVTTGPDARWAGVSPADEAALELALTLAGPADVVRVVALAPVDAERLLRDAVAAGASEVVRIDAATSLPSRVVADTLADVCRGADLIVCGDYSLDRGSGSVPAFVAAHLDIAQALGLVEIHLDDPDAGGALRATRRLDGGRRELVEIPTPAVVSVEGSVATLRRASLAHSLGAKRTGIDVRPGPVGDPEHPHVRPYRPRTRVVPAPRGTTLLRVRDLLDIGGGPAAHAETVHLEPEAAARRLLDQLREWGYLDGVHDVSETLCTSSPDEDRDAAG